VLYIYEVVCHFRLHRK